MTILENRDSDTTILYVSTLAYFAVLNGRCCWMVVSRHVVLGKLLRVQESDN